MTETIAPFDRDLVRRRRERAAPGIPGHDFLLREVAERLVDRLDDLDRRFPVALDLGAHHGPLARMLAARPGTGLVVAAEHAASLLHAAPPPRVVADEEALPFAERSLDLVASALSLHWVNDLPGALVQIRQSLRPDGLFLAGMLGGDTLAELRAALFAAEVEAGHGVAPRVSPFVDVRDAGALLQRAGFALPVVDADTITVTYETPLGLLRDLRGMGETSALLARSRRFLRRDVLLDALSRYASAHSEPDGRVRATFQVIWLTGWAPAASQQQPLRPGSARTHLSDALGGTAR